MQDKKIIQNYINNFRRYFTTYLKPGIGLACKVYPATSSGAILVFSLGPNVSNEDEYLPSQETVNTSLKTIEQRMVGGNLDGIRFSGTNISMEPAKLVLIKGEDSETLWDDKSAREDVERIIKTSTGGQNENRTS